MASKSIPQRILEYVIANAVKGDVNDIIEKIDHCCYTSVKGAINVGDKKGVHLDTIVKDCNPKMALELGAYAGYSALRIARAMPADGKLYSIEKDESNAEVTRQMITFAGLEGRVNVLLGSSDEVLKTLTECFDFVFLDHWKDLYKPDLLLLEQRKLIHNGSVIAADNIVYPGCPDFLAYVRNSPKYECKTYMARLEYRDTEDGIEKAVYKI